MSLAYDYTIDPREMGKTTHLVTVSRLVWQTATIEVEAYDDDDAIDRTNYVMGIDDAIEWENDEIVQVEYEVETT